jgi:hypothetical protein
MEEENKKLRECLAIIRSQLFDRNNEETILTILIDNTLNDGK